MRNADKTHCKNGHELTPENCKNRVDGKRECKLCAAAHAKARRRPSRTYKSWDGMRSRCLNPNHHKYSDYGGRGITVCERWSAFKNFLADMGERPRCSTLDRINVNGNYEPSNCRWATMKEQRNNARNTIYLEYRGRTQAAGLWSQEYGVKHRTFMSRIHRGWSMEAALFSPIRRQHGGRQVATNKGS